MEMPWKNVCKQNQRGVMAGDKRVKRGEGVAKEVSGCIFLEREYMMRPEARRSAGELLLLSRR